MLLSKRLSFQNKFVPMRQNSGEPLRGTYVTKDERLLQKLSNQTQNFRIGGHDQSMPKLTFSQDNHSAEYSLKNAKYQDKSNDIRKMKEMGMRSNFQISQDNRVQGSLTSNMINFNSS